MDVLYSPKVQKQNSSLSQLAKGVGEIGVGNQQEKRLEILLDETVKDFFNVLLTPHSVAYGVLNI
jgi:hypothetical protein